MRLRLLTSGSPLNRTAQRLVLMSLVFLLASADRSLAQLITGTLYGKVTTADGAALPGVTVTITSPQLIKAAEVRTTNAAGEFLVPNLPPGIYSVLAALQGFTSQRRDNVGLRAGASLGLDFQLSMAGRTESVDVVAEAPLVDVKSSQVTRTVGEEVIAHAPIARRSFGQLLKSL